MELKKINIESTKGTSIYIPSAVNMQIGETGKSASLQLGFGGKVNYIPLCHLLKIHSSVTGKYQLSYGHIRNPGEIDLIVNPVQEAPKFIEGIKWAYNLLEKSGKEQELTNLLNSMTGNPKIDSVMEGEYAKKLFEVMEINVR